MSVHIQVSKTFARFRQAYTDYSPRRLLKAFCSQDGVAAIEFALIGGFASVSALNVADIAIYAADRLEVENATSMGAQAAWKTCDSSHLPATVNCPGLSAAVTTAVHGTMLGTNVSLKAGFPSEGYYCVNSTGVLTYASSVATKPNDCSAQGVASNSPGDYIEVQTTYTYSPIFPAMTLTSAFGTTISKTAWMRLG
jgi:Flp pilus assembly protein TadG